MSDKTKKSATPRKRSKLPRSGLAEDILGAKQKEEDEQQLEPETPEISDDPAPTLEKPSGPERIFDFADIINQNSDASQEHQKAEKLETWVTFDLASEVFALPVSHVQEILRVGTITVVPHAPNPVRGVTNKRGRVLPVVDLRLRLGLREVEVGPKSRILVVESQGRLLGLLVDGVQQVLRIALSQVQPPPPDVMTEQSDYIIGVYHLDENLAILLDVNRVLVVREQEKNSTTDEKSGT